MKLLWLIIFIPALSFASESSVYSQTPQKSELAVNDASSVKGSYDSTQPKVESQNVVQLLVGLIFVVGLIFACAWVVRRIGGVTGLGNQHIKTIACLPMGSKEKLVIVEVGKKQLLLGVTPSKINCLTTLEDPIDLESNMPDSQFADRIKRLLKGPLSEIEQK